jgi:hypothetical protein
MSEYIDECGECQLQGTMACCLHNDSERQTMSSISKETFMEMSTDSKLGVLFDYMLEIQYAQPKRVRDRDLKCTQQAKQCSDRFGKIEKTLHRYKIFSTGAAFIGGFVGGWSAVWTAFKLSLF